MNCQDCSTALPQHAHYCSSCGSLQYVDTHTQDSIELKAFSPLKTPVDEKLSRDSAEPLHHAGEDSPEEQKYQDNPGTSKQEESEEDNNERLMVFSDGVIAFALTVAAITIKIPATNEQLEANSTSIILRCCMYIIAFIIVAATWADHHTLFHHIKRNDFILVVTNFVALAAIVMFPIGLFFMEFGAELVNTNESISTTQIEYGFLIFLGSQFVGGLALLGMWIYATRRSRFVEVGLERRYISYMSMHLLSKPLGQLLILLAILVGASTDNITLLGILWAVIALAWIAYQVYLRLYRRGLNLAVGSDDTQRIQLFSDAVIGIAITLAVAQIEFPSLAENSANVSEVVGSQLPLIHAFIVGIVMMGVYWLFHYHLFRLIKRHDGTLVFLNCFFLLCIVLMIIPINWFVNYYSKPDMFAHIFFGIWQIFTSLILAAMWWHAQRKKRLLSSDVDVVQSKQMSIIIIANPITFFLLTIYSSYVPVEPSIYIGIYLALIGGVWLALQLYRRFKGSAQKVVASSLQA